MQRLLLMADEIEFIDRPSVGFDNWGLVGSESHVRTFKMPDDSPVKLVVHAPPDPLGSGVYQRYLERDLGAPVFVQTVLAGLRQSDAFARKFIQPDANYGIGNGRQVRAALVVASGELGADHLKRPVEGRHLFKDTPEGRRETLKSVLYEASVYVTIAMLISEQTGALPVADDPYFCRLLALRAGDAQYVGNTPRAAAGLGLAIAQAVIPDNILSELSFGDVLDYRKATADAHRAWTTEVNRLAADLAGLDGDDLDNAVRRTINRNVEPRLVEYRNEMRSARDRMFGDLVKKLTAWELPTLTLSFLLNASWHQALAAFGGALSPAIPALVNYLGDARKARRDNAMSYLIEAAPTSARDR